MIELRNIDEIQYFLNEKIYPFKSTNKQTPKQTNAKTNTQL